MKREGSAQNAKCKRAPVATRTLAGSHQASATARPTRFRSGRGRAFAVSWTWQRPSSSSPASSDLVYIPYVRTLANTVGGRRRRSLTTGSVSRRVRIVRCYLSMCFHLLYQNQITVWSGQPHLFLGAVCSPTQAQQVSLRTSARHTLIFQQRRSARLLSSNVRHGMWGKLVRKEIECRMNR